MECQRCGVIAPYGKRFCGACGVALLWQCAFCSGTNPQANRFCGDCGNARPNVAPQAAPKPPVSGPERRQLTVMFCDMVGSTALGVRLDPEDLREVMGAYHREVTGQVMQFGGFVARYMGDGVLIYFGYPRATENDPERAIRAGLAIVDAIRRLATIAGPPGTLAVRVGIATGLVVVGDLVGSGAAREEAVVGETPNLAARLQSMAEPNSVLIADATHRLTGRFFEYRLLNAVNVRGYDAPIPAWRVLREAAVDSRFEALRTGARTPVFGRDEELTLLRQRWDQARAGTGRVVLLMGEAGIGKSRLAAALEEDLRNQPHLRIRWVCSPHYQGSVLHPITAVYARSAGFAPEDDAATRLAKLEALLAQMEGSNEEFALIAGLLSLPVPAEVRPTELMPQRRKERTFAAILRHLEAFARAQPLLGVFEDLHWADPTTLEVLDRLVSMIDTIPMLLVATTRPDVQLPWTDRPRVSTLMLQRLGRQEALSLVEWVSAGRALNDPVRAEIIAHADGVPLFVEELTKTVLDKGPAEAEAWHSPANRRAPGGVVPSSLHASLMSRLDRVASVKEVAQMAAVMGREFLFETFLAAFHLPRDLAAAALGALVEGDVMVEHGRPSSPVYGFKHALMQDAAYTSLLRERRRTLHLHVAETLERDATGTTEPELLAYHFAEAGAADRAIDYYLKAAELAMSRSAVTEMVSHLQRGLGLLASLPDSPAKRRRELALRAGLGRGLSGEIGSASDEGHGAFARARTSHAHEVPVAPATPPDIPRSPAAP